jgi:IS30 family transposase
MPHNILTAYTRRRIIALRARALSIPTIAQTCGVCEPTVRRVLREVPKIRMRPWAEVKALLEEREER